MLRPREKPQISPLRYPVFPVEVDGVGKGHASFLEERRTQYLVQSYVAGNPGTLCQKTFPRKVAELRIPPRHAGTGRLRSEFVTFYLPLQFAAGKLARASANKHRRGSLGYARDRLFDSAP
jgi:hypothetical protein